MSALIGMLNVTVVTKNDYLLNINSHIYHTAKLHPPAYVDKCNLLAVFCSLNSLYTYREDKANVNKKLSTNLSLRRSSFQTVYFAGLLGEW